MNTEIPILFVSCDNYYSLWNPFFHLLNKYWKTHPKKVYICSETKTFSYDDFDFVSPPESNAHENKWSKRLTNTIVQIKEDFIFFVLEDYFLFGETNLDAVDNAIQTIQNDMTIACIHFEYRIGEENKSKTMKNSPYFRSFNSETSNLATTSFSIWRKSSLLEILCENENAWEFEYHGGYRLSRLVKKHKYKVLFSKTELGEKFPFRYHDGGVVTKGCLNPSKANFFLNNDGIVIPFETVNIKQSDFSGKKYKLFTRVKREIHKYVSYFKMLRKHSDCLPDSHCEVKTMLQVGMSTNYGGTEAFLMNLYRNIDRTKYQFDFLNVYDEPLACQDEIIALGGNIYNLHLRRRQDGLQKYKEGIKKFYKEHHFDVVVQNVQDLINIDMLIYAKKYGIKKRIVYGHNSGFGMKPSKLSLISHKLNKLRVNKYVTNYVAVSDKASEFLYPKKVQDRVTIIPNLIDFEKFKYNEVSRNRLRKELNIGNKKVYGIIARIDPQKNHSFLIDIFNEILRKEPESIMVVVGSGPLEQEIKDKVNRLGIDKSVIFTGYVSNTNDYYSLFDIFLYPTNFEGFGIVLEEAQTSGLPTLCSDVVPTNVIVTDLVKLLPLGNANYWAEQALLLELNKGRDKYLDILSSAFDKEKTIKTICDLYE